ncbi:MAG: hypothetical protein OXC30_05165 [Alphaproteobacteria bacterium]|nr:hypothetical protein [Alphaproteobacteria bacterium]
MESVQTIRYANIFYIQSVLLLCALILYGASFTDETDAETPDGFVLDKNDSAMIAKWLSELDGMIGEPIDFPVQKDLHDSADKSILPMTGESCIVVKRARLIQTESALK